MSASHNRYIIIIILGALSTISPFAIDMYLPMFPEMAASLHTSIGRIPLSLARYFVGMAAGQLFYGPLLDRFGRKLPLYAGLLLFVVACVLCLGARTVEWLIAMRFVQAIGGCAAQVAAMAMVRDFFHVKETAKIISLLILIISASPLLAPTVGYQVSTHLGWQWVFVILGAFALFMLAIAKWCLPEGHKPDPNISLRPPPILRGYAEMLHEPQFITYSLAGAFAFSGLLVYVSTSPIIFMEVFQVTKSQFSGIFAGLAVGFIGANQVNVLLLRKFTSEQIFRATMILECPVALLFLAGTYFGWLGLPATLVLLFISLSSLGLAYPNAAALSLVPFDHNIGSASAMLGFLQIGIAGLASASVGIFNSHIPCKLGQRTSMDRFNTLQKSFDLACIDSGRDRPPILREHDVAALAHLAASTEFKRESWMMLTWDKTFIGVAQKELPSAFVISPEMAMDFAQPCRRLSDTQWCALAHRLAKITSPSDELTARMLDQVARLSPNKLHDAVFRKHLHDFRDQALQFMPTDDEAKFHAWVEGQTKEFLKTQSISEQKKKDTTTE